MSYSPSGTPPTSPLRDEYDEVDEKENVSPIQTAVYPDDCLQRMATFPDNSVDLVVSDPPYGCTANEWDGRDFCLEKCWEQYERIVKPNGLVILFAVADSKDIPFLTRVLTSKPKGWKLFTMVWEKSLPSGGAHAQSRPLRYHEDIVVFYRNSFTYNPQMWKPGHVTRNFHRSEERFPRSITPVFAREKGAFHPTQKPVKLMEYLVKTFSNVGDAVLDNTMGSGSTGVACVNTHRSFVGIENDPVFFPKAQERIEKAKLKMLYEPLEDEGSHLSADDIKLPPLKDELNFDAKNFMKFYRSLPHDQMPIEDVLDVVVKYLNRYFALIKSVDISCVEISYKYRPQFEGITPVKHGSADEYTPAKYTIWKTSQVKNYMAKCRVVNEDGKLVNVYDVWNLHLDSAEYRGLRFDPTNKPSTDNTLNVFPGLKVFDLVKPVEFTLSYDMEKVQPILDHIKALAGGVELCYEYFVDWLAYPIQTGEKTNVALLVKGRQGCGKGLLFEELMMNLVYGENLAVQLNGGKQIAAKFNSAWSKKMLVIVDEPNKLSIAERDNLKNLITSGTIMVSERYMTEKFEEDYTNYVFTCNHVPEDFLEHDDRRFFVVEHTGENVQDKEYFARLRHLIYKEHAYKDFYMYLADRQIRTFKKGEAPPLTRVKERLCIEDIDPIFRYLRYLVDEDPSKEPYKKEFAKFFNDAMEWCAGQHLKVTWARDSKDLRKILRSKLPELQPPHTRTDEIHKPSNINGKTVRCFCFPHAREMKDILIANRVYMDADEFRQEEVAEAQSSQTWAEEVEELPDYDDAVRDAEIERMKMDLELVGMCKDSELNDQFFDKE